jgi:hypothetical protein
MQNEQTNDLAINHSLSHLLEWMQVLDVKKMKSSSKIKLKNVLWWMFIKKAWRLKLQIIVKLSQKKMHIYKYKKKVILKCTKTWLKKMGPL